jgi:2-oxoglutarate dehydrogenase E1 component
MVIFSPKSMLRLRAATSSVADFTEGHFRAIITDSTVAAADVRKVLLCSGKVYYDLVAERAARGVTDTAVIRLERLYPLPVKTLPAALAAYPGLEEVRWVQEEPANQGAWPFMALNLVEVVGRPITRVSRNASSSPAVGSHNRHDVEQRALVAAAFA